MEKVTILLRDGFYRQYETRLKEIAPNATFLTFNDRDEMLDKLPEADGLYGGSPRGDTLDRCRRLRWIHMRSAGVERYFPAALAKLGVTLTNGSGAFDTAIAEHVFAMALALTRGLTVYIRNQTERKWDRAAKIVDLRAKTLGVDGMGSIGTRVAEVGSGMGMRAIGLTRRERAAPAFVDALWTHERRDEFLRDSDFVVVCLPLTEETRGTYGPREFGSMKQGAFFFNIGRGRTVDTAALTEALRSGRLAGAGLDVVDPEPLPKDSPLWGMSNVVITPHMSGSSDGTDGCADKIALENIRRFAAGEPLKNVVDPELGY